MKTRSRYSLILIVLGVLLLMSVGTLEAKRPPKQPVGAGVPELRKEIAELRAAVARLQSMVNFQAREAAAPGPSSMSCGDPCAEDSDTDGLNDCEDPCPCDAGNTDTDGDGALDCYDPCPDDSTDACIDPCRTDSDEDGVNDCEDLCPWDPAPPADDDQDGIPNCQDPCPDDPANECSGPCPPLDQDGDEILDCVDPCPWGDDTGMPCAATAPSSGPSEGVPATGMHAATPGKKRGALPRR